MTGYDDIWKQKKKDILNGINKLMSEDSVDKEILDVMKEMVERTQVRPSMGDYMDEQLEEED